MAYKGENMRRPDHLENGNSVFVFKKSKKKPRRFLLPTGFGYLTKYKLYRKAYEKMSFGLTIIHPKLILNLSIYAIKLLIARVLCNHTKAR